SGNSFAFTEYAAADGAFRYTKGGTWTKEGDRMLVTYEFHTESAEKVGTQESWQTTMKDGKLSLMTKASQGAYIAIDEPKVSPLQGPYLFSGRKKDGVGELRTRSTDGPRKTMKILTGSHFQWIAYNTETKEFFGTGGGSYTAEEGKYVENIEFFSRDNSRVGASLNFQFKVVDGDWHHSGKSSKGAPMYEVWAKRK
ncbi:MAG: membrane or secreted protein, partial [Bacteroidota bacterium]